MKLLSLIIMVVLLAQGETILFDFNSAEKSGKWYAVNDDVMGGVSQSMFAINSDGTATFSGIVSLENNGGFASVRAPVNNMSESNFKGVILRLKGDGNKYSVRFRNNRNFDSYAYQAKVETTENTWEEFKIPFDKFKPTFRGYALANKPALESKAIAQIGMLIADKQSGEFELVLDWIKFYE